LAKPTAPLASGRLAALRIALISGVAWSCLAGFASSADAAARGITDGDGVRVFNALGDVRCNAGIGSWIRRGTVSLPKGLWRKHTANGYTGTSLVPDTLTDVAGGACFNDARVQVSRQSAVGSRQESAGRRT